VEEFGRALAGSGADTGTAHRSRRRRARRFRHTAMVELDTDPTARAFVVETLPDRERVIVAPRGALDTATVARVSDEMDALVAAGFADLVLDLRAVTFVDGAGLGLAIAQAGRSDAAVHLVDGPPAVARIFDLAGVREDLPFVPPFELARQLY
jgi:anti-sigma B factor antagonist